MDRLTIGSGRAAFTRYDNCFALAQIPIMDRIAWSCLACVVTNVFFPPLGLLFPILFFYREVTWMTAIGMICSVLFVPVGILPKLYAFVIAVICLWCLNGEKIVAWLNQTPHSRKTLAQEDVWSRRMGFAFAALFIPAYLYVAIVWSQRQPP